MPPYLTLLNIFNAILFYFLIIVFTEIIFLAYFFEAVSLVAEAELKLMAVSLLYCPEC